MQLNTVASVLAVQLLLATASTIPAGLSKRAAVSNATLIAYGTDTEGWPVAYGLDDGKLICIALIMRHAGLEANLFIMFSEALYDSQPQRYYFKLRAFVLGYVSY